MPPVSRTKPAGGSVLKGQQLCPLSWSLQSEVEEGRKWTITQATDSNGEKVCEEKLGV